MQTKRPGAKHPGAGRRTAASKVIRLTGVIFRESYWLPKRSLIYCEQRTRRFFFPREFPRFRENDTESRKDVRKDGF